MKKDNIGLLYFHGTNCPVCKTTQPVINRIAKRHTVIIIDVEEHPKMASNYQIMSIPTLIITRDDEVVHSLVGTRILKIEEKWNELMSP